MEGNIIQLKEYHLNKGASKDHTPVFPMTKASAIEGMAELLKDLKISGVTPTSDISDVSSPEKGKIYYEESTDKYYVYSEDKSSFVELGAGASVEPSDVMPTVTQTTSSSQSGGDNIITFTFPNGETTEVVIKNGAQGNSGVASADEVVVVNNLTEGGTSVTENGVTKVKVLSAEMGKELAQQSIIESGTFAKAYLKAIDTNVPFPWVLKDIDGNGNSVTKVIWHTGDRKFIDATGAEVDWYKYGITVITDAPAAFRVKYSNNDVADAVMPNAGFHYIPFSALATNVHTPADGVSSCYFSTVTEQENNGIITYVPTSSYNIVDMSLRSRDIKYVNFGGLKTNRMSFNTYQTSLPPNATQNKYEIIENLELNAGRGATHTLFQNAVNLREVNNLYGNIYWTEESQGTSTFNTSVGQLTRLKKLDLKNLNMPLVNIGSYMVPNIEYLDIRGMNPSNIGSNTSYTLSKSFLSGLTHLKTLIIGNFDTSKIVGDGGNSFISGDLDPTCTLVCVNPTPPPMDTNHEGYIIDNILSKVASILVPPGCATIYKNTDVWSNYASIISEYNRGDY